MAWLARRGTLMWSGGSPAAARQQSYELSEHGQPTSLEILRTRDNAHAAAAGDYSATRSHRAQGSFRNNAYPPVARRTTAIERQPSLPANRSAKFETTGPAVSTISVLKTDRARKKTT